MRVRYKVAKRAARRAEAIAHRESIRSKEKPAKPKGRYKKRTVSRVLKSISEREKAAAVKENEMNRLDAIVKSWSDL